MEKNNRLQRVGIIGLGFVGSALYDLLDAGDGKDYKICPYSLSAFNSLEEKEAAKNSDIAFVCVGTPMKEDKICDLSQLEEVLGWCEAKVIVIKSTIPPGTTETLASKFNKRLVHNPEFLTERNASEDMRTVKRTVLGGDKKDSMEVCRLYQKVYDHSMQYVFCTSRVSEMVKYVTNAYFTVKVAFINQIFDICQGLSIDYDELKEIWLLEPRMTRSHTLVTEDRGYGGHCFPKDLNALIKASEDIGVDVTLLKEVWNYNCKIRKEFKGREYTK